MFLLVQCFLNKPHLEDAENCLYNFLGGIGMKEIMLLLDKDSIRRGITFTADVGLVISIVIIEELFCSMASLYCIFFPLGFRSPIFRLEEEYWGFWF